MKVEISKIKIRRKWNLARRGQTFTDRKKKINKNYCRQKD